MNTLRTWSGHGDPHARPNAVDWEARVDVDRLRTDRLDRLRQHLDASELGSLLTFDFSNIRYMTATHIGTWAMDKLIRFALLPRGAQPVVWDFGSAARHHQLYNPWLDYDRKPGDRELSEAARPADPERVRGSLRCVARSIRTQASRKRWPARWRPSSGSTSSTRSRSEST